MLLPYQAAAEGPGPMGMLFPFAMMFLIFYVIVFRPQAKQRKQHQAMLGALKKNDEVITNGGIFGKVVNIKPDAITLRVDENVRIDVERSAISKLVKEHGKPAAEIQKA